MHGIPPKNSAHLYGVINKLKITRNVLDIIGLSVAELSWETGGILGSRDGTLIDALSMDQPRANAQWRCAYAPNVHFLNGKLGEWQREGIHFKGIFHTHFANVKTLSEGDIKYIHTILSCMPPRIRYLYFPIFILPKYELISYRAERKKKTFS